MSDSRQLCTFLLDGLLFGVDVIKVQEVLRYQEVTRVPLTSSMVRGLINLRGQIVTAIDMRARLGLPPLGAERQPMNVVLLSEGGVVSLLVDDIGDVLELQGQDFEPTPETMMRVFREVALGVYKLEDKLLLLLDVEHVVSLGAEVEQRGSAAGEAA